MAKKSKARRHHPQRHGPRPVQRPGPPRPATQQPTATDTLAGGIDTAADIGDETGTGTLASASLDTAQAPTARTAPAPSPTGLRRVGRIDPATGARARPARPSGGPLAGFEPLDPEDPAIPFDRVPYVPADLRRVAIMAGLMVVLIVVAAVVVTNLVK